MPEDLPQEVMPVDKPGPRIEITRPPLQPIFTNFVLPQTLGEQTSVRFDIHPRARGMKIYHAGILSGSPVPLSTTWDLGWSWSPNGVVVGTLSPGESIIFDFMQLIYHEIYFIPLASSLARVNGQFWIW